MIDSVASSRTAATQIPAGPAVEQFKEKVKTAGTEGPPQTAVARADQFEPARDTSSRDVARTDEGRERGSEVARSAVQDQMRTQDTGDDGKQDQKLKEQMAKAAYAETQFITRKADEYRAEKMRIAM